MIHRMEAQALLDWAAEQNPGPWRAHSLHAARAAETIAARSGMDPQRAWVLGALHDIGRYEGVRDLHHVVAGYRLLMEKGDPGAAQIAMTHSYPSGDPRSFMGEWDVSDAERAFVIQYLAEHQMDEWDRLIQLCDALCMASGVCLIEKRLIDVALRHGVTPEAREKWRATLDICRSFEQKMGCSVYSLFDEAVSNTFSSR